MALKFVSVEGLLGGFSRTAPIFPAGSQPYLLHSSWHCMTTSPPDGGSNLAFTGTNIFYISVSNRAIYPSPFLAMTLNNGATEFYNASWVLPPNLGWNIQISVDCIGQVVQVYCNDIPATLIGGGFLSSGTMSPGGFQITSLDVGSHEHIYPAVADLWETMPLSFVDLSVTANRRKFINADLSPANLGPNGENPFGFPPLIYLTAPSSPSDILINYGTGGSFSLSAGVVLAYQTPGTCPFPEPPPPPPPPPSVVFCPYKGFQ